MEHTGRTEELFQGIFQEMGGNQQLEAFRPSLEEAHQSYQAWAGTVERVMGHTASLLACREQLYENGAKLEEISGQLVAGQQQSASDQAAADGGWAGTAYQIERNITAYRLGMRSIVETMDVADLGTYIESLDRAIQMSEEYQGGSEGGSVGPVLQLAASNRSVAQEFGEICRLRAADVAQADALGEATSALLFAAAASSEQMAAQAAALDHILAQFKLVKNSTYINTLTPRFDTAKEPPGQDDPEADQSSKYDVHGSSSAVCLFPSPR